MLWVAPPSHHLRMEVTTVACAHSKADELQRSRFCVDDTDFSSSIIKQTLVAEIVVRLVVVLSLPTSHGPIPAVLETVGAETFHVGRWIGLEDRLDDVAADASRARHAMGVATAGHNEPFHA